MVHQEMSTCSGQYCRAGFCPFLNYISSEALPSCLTEVLQPPASTLTPTSGAEVNSRYISCFFSPPDGFSESERGLIRADAVTAGVSMALQCGRS